MNWFRMSLALFLSFGSFASPGLVAQTCTVTAGTGTPDSYFDSEYTENGPGTGKEPVGMPGWTGADSTYSVLLPSGDSAFLDRKSTRLNSSHQIISYAVFCLKKKRHCSDSIDDKHHFFHAKLTIQPHALKLRGHILLHD